MLGIPTCQKSSLRLNRLFLARRLGQYKHRVRDKVLRPIMSGRFWIVAWKTDNLEVGMTEVGKLVTRLTVMGIGDGGGEEMWWS